MGVQSVIDFRLEICYQELDRAVQKGSRFYTAYWTRQIHELLKPCQQAERNAA